MIFAKYCQIPPHTHVNYADDNSLLVIAKDITTLRLEWELVFHKIKEWTLQNNQFLNMSKTEIILFKTKRSNMVIQDITMCSTVFTLRNCIQILGLKVDENLDWNISIDFLLKKLNQVSYCIKILKRYCDKAVLLTVYYGVFVSKLKYGILLWGNASDVKKIFCVQKHVLRIIFDLPFRESCRGKFRSARLLTVPALYISECLLFNFKYKERFEQYLPDHQHNTRMQVNYNYPRHGLSMFEKGPSYSSIKLFNKLPANIKCIGTFRLFKREIHDLLVNLEPYSISEFLDS